MNDIARLEISESADENFEAFVRIHWNYKDFNITARKRNDRIKRRFKQLNIDKDTTLSIHDDIMVETCLFFVHKQDAVDLYFRGV